MSNQTTQSLFTATDSISTGTGSYSRIGSVYNRGQVALFVDNPSARSIEFSILVGVAAVGQPAGRNSLPADAKADDLFPLLDKNNLATEVKFTVASGKKAAVDLSAFAPEFIGLHAVATGGAATGVVAYAFGHA